MDNLSSSELESPSKTPLFVAIAAVFLAIAGACLAWMGFSKASELEQQIAALGDASERMVEIEKSVATQGSRMDQLVTNVGGLSQDVKRVLGEVEEDISKIKKNIRSVAIEAGTAKRMVEDLESKGVKVAAQAPAKSTAASAEPDAAVSTSKGGVYTIKSNDTLGRIAAAYKITLNQLQAANPGVDARRLRIGQQIVIPASE